MTGMVKFSSYPYPILKVVIPILCLLFFGKNLTLNCNNCCDNHFLQNSIVFTTMLRQAQVYSKPDQVHSYFSRPR